MQHILKGREFQLILICFESISEIFVIKIEKVVIGKYSEEEILWRHFIFSLKCYVTSTNWKELLDKYRLKIKGLLKFGNLSWKWWTLIVFTISITLPPKKILKNALVCPIVIKRIKTKLKPISNGLSPYAPLTRP